MRYLIYFLFLALCHHAAYAQKIYKWTDGNGKTHYGDKPTVKGTNKVTVINNKKSPTREPVPLSDEAEVDAPVSASQSNVSKCVAIAREAAAMPSTAHPERKRLFKKLQFLCPNKVYDCTSYKVNPNDVVCKASTKQQGSSFFTERKLGSGRPATEKPIKRQRPTKELMI